MRSMFIKFRVVFEIKEVLETLVWGGCEGTLDIYVTIKGRFHESLRTLTS